mmetsp:Transcript_36192/g.73568  ORF Transcript_36192/g.73568 Transcript_36192/m.73568 type:complete len:95 (-) Transcript_36192:219-503(-)
MADFNPFQTPKKMSSVPQVRRAPSAQINFATLFEDFENSRISLVTAIANNRDRSLARSDVRTVEKDRAAHAAFREEQREQRREGPSKLVRSVRW